MRYKFSILFVVFSLIFIPAYSQPNPVKQNRAENKSESDILFLDGHTHLGFGLTRSGIVLNTQYMEERKVNAFVFTLPVDLSKTNNLITRISSEIAQIKNLCETNDQINVAESAYDVDYNFGMKKLSAIFSIEYYNGVFGGDVETIESYAAMGIHTITLVDNRVDDIFEHCTGGVMLTDFGKSVVDKMNQLGIVIDVKHLPNKAIVEVAKYSKKPIVSSHSHAIGITNLNFNLSDEALEAIKENHGKVMVSFSKDGLFNPNEVKDFGVERLVSHIDYIKKKIGIDNVGIGSDLQANGRYVSKDLNSIISKRLIIEALKKREYSTSDIEKVMGKNYLMLLQKF